MAPELRPTPSQLFRPAIRLRDYLHTIRILVTETRDEVHATRALLSERLTSLDAVTSDAAGRLSQIALRTEQLLEQAGASVSSQKAKHEQLVGILRFIHDRAQRRRALLQQLRVGTEYQRAYLDANPRVSIVIPTYDNYALLRERSIPSALAQTYTNFEIVVVGDAASDEARTAAESFGDSRISFFNLPYRGPYPEDPETRWLVAGVPPYNEAVRRATGEWIAPLDDDDAFRPQHIERLLARARQERLELVYGQICVHRPGGDTTTVGRFPPQLGQFGVQAALYHAALAESFELELADAAFGLPYDWALCLRMLEAGVRIGMLEEETVDYYPSRFFTPRWQEDLGVGDDEIAAEPHPGDVERTTAALPEWEYVPEGWDRTRRRGEDSTVGWRAASVAQAYLEKWPRFLEAVEGPGPLGVNHEVPANAQIERDDVFHQNAVLAFAFALARAAGRSNTLSVLEWGGALGHYHVLACQLMPGIRLDYHCRELPAVCAAGRTVRPEVTFHDSDDCFDRRYDLVMASNSLQYEESWQHLLLRLGEAAGAWMFLTRVLVTSRHASFVVLQRAHAYGYATEYLGWVVNRDELLSAAGSGRLRLEREFALHPGWPIHGAPAQASQQGFLFRAAGV